MSKALVPAQAPTPSPTPTEAQAVEEKKPEKKAKPKAPKRRIQAHRLFKVEGDDLMRLRKECPRCGRGYFMAQHVNRLTCGSCGYTVYLQDSAQSSRQ